MATTISEMVRATAPASRLERLAALAFMAALAIPGVALLGGMRPPELENTTPAPFPHISIDGLTETATYAAIDRFLADALPGRDVAVASYARLDYRLLGGSTNRDVILGAGDWLFFAGELRPTCGTDAAGLLAAVDDVAARARASGIDFRFVVAPDKHAIYPERLRPGSPVPPACTDAQRAALRRGMAARRGSTVDLWAPVMAARAGQSEPLYFSQDSHWTPTGALPAIRALVESIRPGTWAPSEITADGTSRYPMELARLMGLPRSATVSTYDVRPSMTVERSTIPTTVDLTEAPDVTDYRVAGPGKVVTGTTLFVYDSFFNINRPRIVPWFEHSVWVHVGDLRAHPELVADLPPIDRVIVERVERDAYDLDLSGLVTPVLDRSSGS